MNILLIGLSLLPSKSILAQVPVREEPRHHNVFENKYLRVLDVWLPPGDTTLFHIHATPSLFVHFSTTNIGSQVKGDEWVKDRPSSGNASYRSFIGDTLVHRVSNFDKGPFHVNDIEILSAYNTSSNNTPLPFPVLFDNERATAYQLVNHGFNKVPIQGRGPMVAELISGDGLQFHAVKNNLVKEIIAGKYLYIEPGESFYFSSSGMGDINLVLFELK
ncbi:hypothetical protein [Flavihumibacter profundi]|uniref:hypothetical protein n=1 Tax=Flavihumibacter profundi TaxID=2716883 RepID=UPI001CC5FDCD|nr:hypothetical protein [Flavihumibacter profundi]MBZ5858340.1 hypothetical protein [Flavihumibacter profundi]